jgi:hypothetical protein
LRVPLISSSAYFANDTQYFACQIDQIHVFPLIRAPQAFLVQTIAVCDSVQLFIAIFYNVLRFIFPYTGALRWYYEMVWRASIAIQLVFFFEASHWAVAARLISDWWNCDKGRVGI